MARTLSFFAEKVKQIKAPRAHFASWIISPNPNLNPNEEIKIKIRIKIRRGYPER
jgi:hypothetical protein